MPAVQAQRKVLTADAPPAGMSLVDWLIRDLVDIYPSTLRLLAPYGIGLCVGVGLAASALIWRVYGEGPASLVLASQGLAFTGFLMLAVQVAGMVRHSSASTVALSPRSVPAASPAAGRQNSLAGRHGGVTS